MRAICFATVLFVGCSQASPIQPSSSAQIHSTDQTRARPYPVYVADAATGLYVPAQVTITTSAGTFTVNADGPHAKATFDVPDGDLFIQFQVTVAGYLPYNQFLLLPRGGGFGFWILLQK